MKASLTVMQKTKTVPVGKKQWSGLGWMTKNLQKFHMSRKNFYKVLNQIKIHPVFKWLEGKADCPQTSVVNQFMVFFKKKPEQKTMVQVLPISITLFSLEKAIPTSFVVVWLKPSCLCVMNTALYQIYKNLFDLLALPLRTVVCRMLLKLPMEHCFHWRLSLKQIDALDFSGRKHGWSLTTMIGCDYNKKIWCCLAGCPGCAHDNCVHNATSFMKRPNDWFGEMECDIRDSAFQNSPFMVSSFRKAKGEVLERDHALH